MLDVMKLRRDFPILDQQIHGYPLAYLDNAATTQKPKAVIDCLTHYYEKDNSNVHRGVHTLAERATLDYENARKKVQQFVNAKAREEIVWVKGTTEAINLVAQSFLRPRLKTGDEILITAMEHHANIVPWQIVAEQTGAVIKVVPIDDRGDLIIEEFEKLLSSKTRLFAVTHVSNVIGTVNPVKALIKHCHEMNVPVLVDGAQSLPHFEVDVQELDCDFFAASSHKCFGPTGIGFLYGKKALLEAMSPYQGGGDMIRTVSFEKTTFNELPYKFEAGTPNIADSIGFGAAIDYLRQQDRQLLKVYEEQLFQYALKKLTSIDGLRVVAQPREHASIISFIMDYAHPHDIGTIVDRHGVAIRVGHHCAMPLMGILKVPATARASFCFYNTFAEIDQLFEALLEVKKMFG